MDVCRACLTNAELLVPINDDFVTSYNLLTGLNIKPLDGLSQYVCQGCLNSVNSFVNFRDQCIASEASLQLLQTIKSEPNETLDQNGLGIEIKVRAKLTEKPLAKRRVGRPRKTTLDNAIQKSESLNKNDIKTEAPIKRRVGRPRKNVSATSKNVSATSKNVSATSKNMSATKTTNDTWVVCPKQDKTSIQNTSTDNGRIGLFGRPRQNTFTTSKSQKWVVCPRKNTIGNETQNDERSSMDDANNSQDNLVHQFGLIPPDEPDDVNNCDLVNKEEIKSSNNNSEFFDFDSTISDVEYELETVKIEDLRQPKSKKPTINGKEDKDYIPCGLCKKKFESQESLSSHLDSHTSGTRCEVCQETFIGWQALLAHRLRHVKSKKLHKCHICFEQQHSPLYFEYHYLTVHSDIEIQDVRMTCKVCLRKFSHPKAMKSHLKNNHRELRYTCDKCSKPFVHKFELIKHMSVHSDDRPFVCNTCGYSSRSSNCLQAHILRKHSESSVKCSTCRKVFSRKETFERHVCRKREEQVCPFCGKVTKFLRRHMRVHNDVRKYACERCPAAFKDRTALKTHIIIHDDLRPFKCEFCPMRFNSHCVLIKHRRVHTGEKPYVCRVCSKGFTGNHNLKVHMRVHGEDLVVKRAAPKTEDPKIVPGKF